MTEYFGELIKYGSGQCKFCGKHAIHEQIVGEMPSTHCFQIKMVSICSVCGKNQSDVKVERPNEKQG